jgi:hypothetical protein
LDVDRKDMMKKEKSFSMERAARGCPLLVLLAFSLLSACRGSEPPEAEISTTMEAATSEPLGTDMTSEPQGTDLTTELVDDEPLGVNIDSVMEQARQTKEQYAAFRDRMFDEGFAQIETILCSTYRLQLLSGKDRDFYKREPELFIEPLSDVLEKQGQNPFIQLDRKRAGQPLDGGSVAEEVVLSIPTSEVYTLRSLSMANLTFRSRTVSYASSDGLTTEYEEQEFIERVAWSFDPLARCDQSYKEPVPNSPTARRESSKNMATLIASSLHGLRAYPAKLETVEREWSRANDLEPILLKLKESLAFNEIDPTAQQNVNNYERELTEAVAELSRALAEGRMESTVDPKEVQEILRIFR